MPEKSNSAETEWTPERIELELAAGTHVIELTSSVDAGPNNGANIDYLRITQEPLAKAAGESEALLL